jgi:hypothetical protein
MTNLEYYQSLSVDEIARRLVRFDKEINWEYGYDDVPTIDTIEHIYTTPDGERFVGDFEEAVEWTKDWLSSEKKDN